ncbi:N-acetylmuramoyl-L-alanine amidase [Streptomyces iconiensis]|uniref:N-acetylmuramoyl-L-alanine amidase n=1 Tax=Streptomyces iconiensis TaxID=1384038 RepID=A0ABT7A783_9ACTN|nr:N-acetylmuramoyl-L-alanine amidase [Streptomyces iconiensis]MDJ1137197.1 N-acetylmuramoyl-L-alanine amidase [Streptomyces iconiensis]
MGQAADQGPESGGQQEGRSEGSPGAEGGESPRAGGDGRGGVSRRRLLIGGGVAVGLAVAGAVAHDDIARWWWRVPGNEKPRKQGVVDDARAQWVAASEANWRRANRPDDYRIDRVVIHVVQGTYPIALKVFRDPAHGSAAHYVVRKDGHLAQTVRELDVAFQAGNREYNERSIGIEHEGWIDQPAYFTDAMYRSSARLTAGICRRYGFPADREHIIGHIEVPGADHTDPGRYWDWNKYMRMIRAELTEVSDAPSSRGVAGFFGR